LIVMSARRRKIMDYMGSELLVDPELGLDEHEEFLVSGRIDSMGVMRLVAFITEEFSITIPNEDLIADNLGSVEAIDAYLSRFEGD
jgi:acyl carrier protein